VVREIIKQRKRLGMTQEELARRMGTKQSVVSCLESGKYTSITLQTLERMAKVLGCALKVNLVPLKKEGKAKQHGDLLVPV